MVEERNRMISSQMLKGILEGCILKVISHGETYGYEISEKLREYGFSNISEGTIYPLLLRLERGGLITAIYRESPVGPKRKYFFISNQGELELSSFHDDWYELSGAVDKLFQQGELENESKNKSS